ncbi:MAG: response regulator transcription factor [Muribaculaceae bacterium]|nr:response regulator transcription factor [Muribaculaceae bacterium]
MTTATTFIIADNQDITRAGLHYYIASIEPTGSIIDVKTKQELISALISCCGTTIVILDYTTFNIASIDELLVIEKRFPTSHWIIFSHELSENLIYRLSVEESISLLLKESAREEIVSALKCAVEHERYICHQITNLLIAKPSVSPNKSNLTVAETEILKLIALGKSVKEIAAIRTSSIHTIITHKKNIFRKIEVNNVHEATKYALRAGLIEMMEYYI